MYVRKTDMNDISIFADHKERIQYAGSSRRNSKSNDDRSKNRKNFTNHKTQARSIIEKKMISSFIQDSTIIHGLRG